MAWIAIVPPSPRHPHERYQDGKRQRSAGIFPTMRRAEAERRAVERAGREQLPRPTEPDQAKSWTLLGEYVTAKWWPAWKDQHPASEYGTRKKVEKRILPTFGDIPLGELDPSTIGTWKAAMVAEGFEISIGCPALPRPAKNRANLGRRRLPRRCSTPRSLG
jgi:hypothetical protein